jgi:fluoroacetyl-CoA thioesterase
VAVEPGLSAQVEHQVSDEDTSQAMGSGDVPVLATPRVLALAEAATVAAVRSALQPGQTSVGTRVALEHTAATAVGARVVARAQLVAVDGRLLQFDVVLEDVAGGVVAHGRVTRVVVERERFVQRARR